MSELDPFRDDCDNARAALEWAWSVGKPVLPKWIARGSLAVNPSTRTPVICVGMRIAYASPRRTAIAWSVA